jgi:hypothetical protein
MFLEEFLKVFEQILNEFRILNEHFDAKSKSKTVDYDSLFDKWIKDMGHRYRGIPLTMHWALSSPNIAKNEIIFDVHYKDDYFFEVKYKFDKCFVEKFPDSTAKFLEVLRNITSEFFEFNEKYDLNAGPNMTDYELHFSDWQKRVYSGYSDVAIDINWENRAAAVQSTPFFLNVMMRDDFLAQIRCKFDAGKKS